MFYRRERKTKTKVDLRDYYKLVRRKKWLALVTFLIVLTFYFISILMKPKLYTASSSILISPPSLEKILLKNIASVASSFELLPPVQLRLISTDAFASKVSVYIKDKHKISIPWQEIKGSRNISIVDQTTIQFNVKHRKKEYAKIIANAYVKKSIEENNSLAANTYKSAKSYLEKQLKKKKENMEEGESKLNNFNQEQGVVDFSHDLQSKVQRLAGYDAQKEEINMQKNEIEQTLSRLQGTLSFEQPFKTITENIPNPDLADFKAQLFPLEAEYQNLKEHLTDEHPKMLAMQKRIAALKSTMRTKIARFVEIPKTVDNPKYASLENLLITMELNKASLSVRENILNTMLQKEKQALSKFTGKDLVYARLLREKETAERLYYSIYDTLEQMKVSSLMQSGNALEGETVQEAYGIARTTPVQALFVILMSLVLSLGVSVILEFIDDTVKMPYHVKRYLNVRVLGSVPKIANEEFRFLPNVSSKSAVSEVYNKIAYTLQKMCLEKHIKTLMFTSAKEGEGKSTMLSNLGVALASIGERVILVDADLRRPNLHKLFSVSNAYGLSSFLSGEVQAREKIARLENQNGTGLHSEEDMILSLLQKSPSRSGLEVLTSGPLLPSPVEALNKEDMKAVIETLKKQGSRVLIDAPPILGVIDAGIVGGLADAVLLILDATTVKRHEAVRAKEILSSLNIKVLGCILNNVEMDDDDGYYYYYHSGYSLRHG